jgi:MazG family protein
MHALRSPDGCPWDAQQTPESLAPYILEEACETIEAIENGTTEKILDELGDLLLQIVFQAQIFSERGDFDFADVAAGIDAKLIRRHPHVFTNQDRQISTEELARQWEHIKREEQAEYLHHPLAQIPANLPALQRAQKLISRAIRMNIELKHPRFQVSNDEKLTEEELGMALLSLTKQAELSGLDAEQSLRRTVQKIIGTPAKETS